VPATTGMRDSILRKCRESIETKEKFFATHAERIEELCEEMAARFRAGNKLYVMGNGGSACDALHVAVEFKHPIIEKRQPLPAEALVADVATLTAIGNDVDFSRVFVNQIKLSGRPGDMAFAISTSGKSPNLIYALQAARERGMVTIALAGKDGGRFPEVAEYCFVVPSFSIHRIQEVQETMFHIVWDLVHLALGAEDVI
jgi:D-sedoheptulose 7-phosphate isomerase